MIYVFDYLTGHEHAFRSTERVIGFLSQLQEDSAVRIQLPLAVKVRGKMQYSSTVCYRNCAMDITRVWAKTYR